MTLQMMHEIDTQIDSTSSNSARFTSNFPTFNIKHVSFSIRNLVNVWCVCWYQHIKLMMSYDARWRWNSKRKREVPKNFKRGNFDLSGDSLEILDTVASVWRLMISTVATEIVRWIFPKLNFTQLNFTQRIVYCQSTSHLSHLYQTSIQRSINQIENSQTA